jgi:hypothetical protein
MSTSKALKRKNNALDFIRVVTIDLCKQEEKSTGDCKDYYRELIESMSIAGHILKRVPLSDWEMSRNEGEGALE